MDLICNFTKNCLYFDEGFNCIKSNHSGIAMLFSFKKWDFIISSTRTLAAQNFWPICPINRVFASGRGRGRYGFPLVDFRRPKRAWILDILELSHGSYILVVRTRFLLPDPALLGRGGGVERSRVNDMELAEFWRPSDLGTRDDFGPQVAGLFADLAQILHFFSPFFRPFPAVWRSDFVGYMRNDPCWGCRRQPIAMSRGATSATLAARLGFLCVEKTQS